jgi:hypothetical protein
MPERRERDGGYCGGALAHSHGCPHRHRRSTITLGQPQRDGDAHASAHAFAQPYVSASAHASAHAFTPA